MGDLAELRRGLAETRGYVLSHHVPAERDRCYAPVAFGRRVHVCARCVGIYPGIAAALLAYALGPPRLVGLPVVALLPAPALVDWAVTAWTGRRGYNPVRTATGFLLGYGYGAGLATLLLEGNPAVLAIGVAYAFLAGALLYARRADADGTKFFTRSG